VEEKELLFPSDLSVVALGRLLDEMLVFGHGFLVGEGDAVYTLQSLVVGVAQEIRGRILVWSRGELVLKSLLDQREEIEDLPL
jgi:hypothetical protein